MDYNPYAAPDAAPIAPFQGATGGTGPQPWDLGEVLGGAWNLFRSNWAVLLFAMLLGGCVEQLPSHVNSVLVARHIILQFSREYWIALSAAMLCGTFIGAFFEVGLTKIWLAAARGSAPEFGELFSGGPRYFAMLGYKMLSALVVGLGLMAFVVPGVILAMGFKFGSFYVVDQEMGPVEAMKASWEATDGQKAQVFLLAVVEWLLGLAGILACCFGALVTFPIIALASTTVYLRISGRGAAVAPSTYEAPSGYGPPAF